MISASHKDEIFPGGQTKYRWIEPKVNSSTISSGPVFCGPSSRRNDQAMHEAVSRLEIGTAVEEPRPKTYPKQPIVPPEHGYCSICKFILPSTHFRMGREGCHQCVYKKKRVSNKQDARVAKDRKCVKCQEQKNVAEFGTKMRTCLPCAQKVKERRVREALARKAAKAGARVEEFQK